MRVCRSVCFECTSDLCAFPECSVIVVNLHLRIHSRFSSGRRVRFRIFPSFLCVYLFTFCEPTHTMDILPSGNIFRELQDIHDTGYFSAQPSLEDHWQQVGRYTPHAAQTAGSHLTLITDDCSRSCS